MRTDVFALGAVTQTDFGYTGQRDVESLGLMDYKARFYDAGLGRFTQPDTTVPNAADPQSWNRYTYVVNNPIRLSDPTGQRVACGVMGTACDEGPASNEPLGVGKPDRGGGQSPAVGTPTPPIVTTPAPCGSIVSMACAAATQAQATSLAALCMSGAPCVGPSTPAPTPTPFAQDLFNDPNSQQLFNYGLPSPIPNMAGFNANQAWNTLLGTLPGLGIPATNLQTVANEVANRVLVPVGTALNRVAGAPNLPTQLPIRPPVLPVFIIPANPFPYGPGSGIMG